MKGVPSARFIQYGLGPIGVEVAALALRRGHQLMAAVDIDPAKAGKPAAALIPAAPPGVIVAARAGDVVNAGADVVLHCTQSRLAQVLPQLLPLADAGLSVISTCEELAFPWHHFPTEAAALDTLARSRGAVVVGLGVNPGFVMDLLPVVLTAPCSDIQRVVVERLYADRPRVVEGAGVVLTRAHNVVEHMSARTAHRPQPGEHEVVSRDRPAIRPLAIPMQFKAIAGAVS